MSKQLLIYTPFAIMPPHFETDLNVLKRFLDNGYEATVLRCSGQLLTCESNPHHRSITCHLCKSRFRSGIAWIGRNRVRIEDFYWLTDAQKAQIAELRENRFGSLDELRAFRLEGSDIGMAAISSAVHFLREPKPDMRVNWDIIQRNLLSAAIVHFSITNHLKQKQPDVFVLFNGRFAALRPALRAAQVLGIETYVHERGGSLDRYSLTRNTYPHDLAVAKTTLNEVYRSAPESDAEKRAIAQEWFAERMANKVQNWFSFTRGQTEGRLPQSLNDSKVNVGVFISSDDEFVAVDGRENPFYQDQNAALRQLFSEFQGLDTVRFFVRVHPNLRDVDNSQTRGLRRIAEEFPNTEIIDAGSSIHTYSLVQAVDLVLTYGSTVAIEAVYLGKPSILMGRHLCEDLGGVIRPASHGELLDIIRTFSNDRSLPPVENGEEAWVKYGFSQKRYGSEFEYASPIDLARVALKTENREYLVKGNVVLRILNKLVTEATHFAGARRK